MSESGQKIGFKIQSRQIRVKDKIRTPLYQAGNNNKNFISLTRHFKLVGFKAAVFIFYQNFLNFFVKENPFGTKF